MKNSKRYKEPLLTENAGCLCCHSNGVVLPMETVLYNGFGGWSILKNGHLFFSENSEKEWEESKTLQGVEDMIGNNETDDFIAFLYTPLRDAKYQRQGKNNWILISQGLGFA